MGDNPTKCSCKAGAVISYVPANLTYCVIRCDWCEALESDNPRLREQVAEFKDAYYNENLEKQRLRNQLQAANAVCEAASVYFIRDRGKSGFRIQEALEAYRATQKGGADIDEPTADELWEFIDGHDHAGEYAEWRATQKGGG